MSESVQIALITALCSAVPPVLAAALAVIAGWIKLQELKVASENRAAKVENKLAETADKLERKNEENKKELVDKVDEIAVKQEMLHQATNGNIEKLIAKSEKAARAEGKAEGVSQEQSRSGAQAALTLPTTPTPAAVQKVEVVNKEAVPVVVKEEPKEKK